MKAGDIQECLNRLPNLSAWPEVKELFPNPEDNIRLDWLLPTFSLQSVGASEVNPMPLISALACLQISIILVDDILDNDPRGKHEEMGVGRTANLALALQSAAHLLLQDLTLPIHRINLISTSLQQMAYLTAVGQEVDVSEITDESSYWALVQAKSTPFYAAALETGAIAGGATEADCRAIGRIGAIFGEIIQIMDDVTDAFVTPAKPDWQRQNNNLLILYAKTANHPQQQLFHNCLNNINQPEILETAQSVLISSGAVSYGIYHIVQRYIEAKSIVYSSDLKETIVLLDLLKQQILPILKFLNNIGADVSTALDCFE